MTKRKNEQRNKAWAEYNSHRQRGDVNCEAAFKAGFDSGVVANMTKRKHKIDDAPVKLMQGHSPAVLAGVCHVPDPKPDLQFTVYRMGADERSEGD